MACAFSIKADGGGGGGGGILMNSLASADVPFTAAAVAAAAGAAAVVVAEEEVAVAAEVGAGMVARESEVLLLRPEATVKGAGAVVSASSSGSLTRRKNSAYDIEPLLSMSTIW